MKSLLRKLDVSSRRDALEQLARPRGDARPSLGTSSRSTVDGRTGQHGAGTGRHSGSGRSPRGLSARLEAVEARAGPRLVAAEHGERAPAAHAASSRKPSSVTLACRRAGRLRARRSRPRRARAPARTRSTAGSTARSNASQVLLVAGAGRQRDVERRLALLVRAARAGIERPLVERDEEDAVVVRERSPACRSRDGRRSRRSRRARAPSRRCAARAAIATLLKRQKPIARPAARGGPGGRTSAKPSRAPPRSPCRPRAAPPRTSSRCRACRSRATSAIVDAADRARRAPRCGSAGAPPRSRRRPSRHGERSASSDREPLGPLRVLRPSGAAARSRGWLSGRRSAPSPRAARRARSSPSRSSARSELGAAVPVRASVSARSLGGSGAAASIVAIRR